MMTRRHRRPRTRKKRANATAMQNRKIRGETGHASALQAGRRASRTCRSQDTRARRQRVSPPVRDSSTCRITPRTFSHTAPTEKSSTTRCVSRILMPVTNESFWFRAAFLFFSHTRTDLISRDRYRNSTRDTRCYDRFHAIVICKTFLLSHNCL